MIVNICEISMDNINLLEKFIKNKMPDTFRYFEKRKINCIKNHILTIILEIDNNPIGYAHIDYCENKYWFGICILENYQSKGYGKKLMNYIFTHQKIQNIKEIYLTVDKININAIKLYSKYNFIIFDEKTTYFLMKKILN